MALAAALGAWPSFAQQGAPDVPVAPPADQTPAPAPEAPAQPSATPSTEPAQSVPADQIEPAPASEGPAPAQAKQTRSKATAASAQNREKKAASRKKAPTPTTAPVPLAAPAEPPPPAQAVASPAEVPDNAMTDGISPHRGTDDMPLIIKLLPQTTPEERAQAAAAQSQQRDAALRDNNKFHLALTALLSGLFLVAGYVALKVRQIASHERAGEGDNIRMRAYLSVVVGGAVTQDRSRNVRFEARPLIINTGQTPAYKVRYLARADILPVPLPDNFALPLETDEVSSGNVGPQQRSAIRAAANAFWDDADVDNVRRANGRALYVWGRVTYEDAFNVERHTNFCQMLSWLPTGEVWVYYNPRHNEAD